MPTWAADIGVWESPGSSLDVWDFQRLVALSNAHSMNACKWAVIEPDESRLGTADDPPNDRSCARGSTRNSTADDDRRAEVALHDTWAF